MMEAISQTNKKFPYNAERISRRGPMNTFTDNQKKSFTILLMASLFLHAAFLVIKFKDNFSISSSPRIEAPAPIKIKISMETIKAMAAMNKRQIVQSEDSASKEKPKTPAYLSDKDRQFDRETLSKSVDVFKNAGKGNAAKTQKASKELAAVQQPKKSDIKNIKLSDLGMAMNEPMPKEVRRAPASVETLGGLENGDPNSQGLSSTNDYVQEVALGDFTHLNTVEFKFYGFYHRIRQKLEQFWGKSIQEKAANIFRSGRRLPAGEDLITSLQITMNEKGEIVKVKVLGASGVKELDDAAIDSFNQAGPFPNPPKDLLVNGMATIEWGFVVKS